MRYLVILILIIGAVFLYTSIAQNKASESDGSLFAEEYSVNWLTDLSVVQAKAKEEGKPILWFTGSDWCGWCID